MYPKPSEILESCRIRSDDHRLNKFDRRLHSTPDFGNNGAFLIPAPGGHKLSVIASDMQGWEHVSVSVYRKNRTPTWEEMCFVKDLFWPPEEEAIQYHPRQSDYVNCHPYTLHIWRPIGQEIARPPTWMVAPVKRAEASR